MKVVRVMFQLSHKEQLYAVHYAHYWDHWSIAVFNNEGKSMSTRDIDDCRPCMVNAQRELAHALDPSKPIEKPRCGELMKRSGLTLRRD